MMKIVYSPYFQKHINFPPFPQNLRISPLFPKIFVFCLIYVFLSPYFDHHALHVGLLDAPKRDHSKRSGDNHSKSTTLNLISSKHKSRLTDLNEDGKC